MTDTDAAATAAPRARPGALIGYARCSTIAQDTEIQRAALAGYGVPAGRVYVNIIRLRTIESMARASQHGRLKDKQPKLNGQQRAHLLQFDRGGKETPTELADLFGVSRATIYRELKKAQEAAA